MTMKLYYGPGACSLSPHIVLREAGLPFTLEKVNIQKHTTADGGDYRLITPKGYVPALQIADGSILTEGPAIVQYIADQKPESGLLPTGVDRYRVAEWLNYISTELHKSFGPLFHKETPEDVKQATRDKIGARLDFVESQLGKKSYLMGDRFTVADAYLFTVLRWSRHTGIELAKWPAIAAYFERVGKREKVQEALAAEGIA